MTPTRVLVLAGTTEASQLIRLLSGRADVTVVASFAGGTRPAAEPSYPTRTGGFGGVDGLVRELRLQRYDALVDATHPFATRMPANAAAATKIAGVPRLWLLRPAWQAEPDDNWFHVDSLTAAAQCLRAIDAQRVLLTTGRTDLAPFVGLGNTQFVVRSIEPPDSLPWPDAISVVARGPFTVESEQALLDTHRIDTLVTKNSGGDDAKLVAARATGVRVVMVRRPSPIDGPTVTTAEAAFDWVLSLPGHVR